MGTLLTICPATGREIETGIETDKVTMARSPDFVGVVHCAVCGKDHPLRKKESWICETIAGLKYYSPAA